MVAVEVLLATPVVLIGLLAVIEFGIILGEMQQVALATRNGARVASRQATLNMAALNTVTTEVNLTLANAADGMAEACRVILSETVTNPAPTSYQNGTCNCMAPVNPAQPVGTVRVTVCVDLLELAPNLLDTFGFDLTGRHVQFTTTVVHDP